MSTTTKTWYLEEYLTSKWWSHVRDEVRRRDGAVCSIVGCKSKRIEFHHLDYLYRGLDQEIDDVVVVCHMHHRLCHYKWFGFKKIPLRKRPLTKRYRYLKYALWRRFKPSSIVLWIDQR